jgi:hypothetical protein
MIGVPTRTKIPPAIPANFPPRLHLFRRQVRVGRHATLELRVHDRFHCGAGREIQHRRGDDEHQHGMTELAVAAALEEPAGGDIDVEVVVPAGRRGVAHRASGGMGVVSSRIQRRYSGFPSAMARVMISGTS